MKKVAIPVLEGKLSPHFGKADKFMFFEIEDGKIMFVEVVPAPEHVEGSFPEWIKSNGANVVIAGGIGAKAIERFNSYGIKVIPNVSPDDARKIIDDYINGTLDRSFTIEHHTH